MSGDFKKILFALLGLVIFLFVEFVCATWAIQNDTEIAEASADFDKRHLAWRAAVRESNCP